MRTTRVKDKFFWPRWDLEPKAQMEIHGFFSTWNYSQVNSLFNMDVVQHTSSYFPWFWHNKARLFSCFATSGWSLPKTCNKPHEYQKKCAYKLSAVMIENYSSSFKHIICWAQLTNNRNDEPLYKTEGKGKGKRKVKEGLVKQFTVNSSTRLTAL
jgi:hypothetical protein